MTIQSKLAAEHQGGHPYSGITGDVYAIRCMSELPSAAKRSDGTSYWLSVPLATLLTTFFIIDAPFSILADTLFLPVDIIAKPEHERWDPFSRSCSAR